MLTLSRLKAYKSEIEVLGEELDTLDMRFESHKERLAEIERRLDRITEITEASSKEKYKVIYLELKKRGLQ